MSNAAAFTNGFNPTRRFWSKTGGIGKFFALDFPTVDDGEVEGRKAGGRVQALKLASSNDLAGRGYSSGSFENDMYDTDAEP
jgi:hypothetical protein